MLNSSIKTQSFNFCLTALFSIYTSFIHQVICFVEEETFADNSSACKNILNNEHQSYPN